MANGGTPGSTAIVAVSATGGTGLAGALVTVGLALTHWNADPNVAAALTTIISTVVSGVSAYAAHRYTNGGSP